VLAVDGQQTAKRLKINSGPWRHLLQRRNANQQVRLPVVTSSCIAASCRCLTLYGHIKSAEQRTIIHRYDDWYTGRWWVSCYIWYSDSVRRGLGGLRPRPVPSSLCQMYQRPVYQLHIIRSSKLSNIVSALWRVKGSLSPMQCSMVTPYCL